MVRFVDGRWAVSEETPHLYVCRMPPVPAQSTRKVLTVDGFIAHRTVKRAVRLPRGEKATKKGKANREREARPSVFVVKVHSTQCLPVIQCMS